MPYTTAIVCLNGHILTYSADHTHQDIKHCPKCGSELIRSCPSCGSPLHGREIKKGTATYTQTPPDSFCYNCGSPYPWTESEFENAELIINELDCLSDAEKEKLRLSLRDLYTETPKTDYAVLLVKKAMMSCKGILKDVLIDMLLGFCCNAVKAKLGIT